MKISAMRLVLVAVLAVASPALAVPNVAEVDCNKGKTITEALTTASPGDTLLISGVCQERVTITTDRITLDGRGTAVLAGQGGGPTDFSAQLTIDGARGVVVKGLTVQNSAGEGILGLRGSAFTVQGTMVQNNAFTGIAVSSSTADLSDTTMRGNLIGLDVFTGSAVILRGSVAMIDNSFSGAEVNGEAVVEIRGAHVQASNNGVLGVVVGSGQFAIFAFPSADGSTLTANGNGFAGILLGNSNLTAFTTGKITAANNAVGIFLGRGFIVKDAKAEFLIENNGVGLNFTQGSGAVFNGPLTVRSNGVGLLADGADTLAISSDDPSKPSSILNNGTDVDLRFGTRVTFNGVGIGTIVCDGTVLSRGTTVCPP